jgi:uncharacterized membrane protein
MIIIGIISLILLIILAWYVMERQTIKNKIKNEKNNK